jgi:hypothetical protein
MPKETKLRFWSSIFAESRTSLQRRISEAVEFLAQMSSLAIAFGAFKALRILGIDSPLVDLLERLDNVAFILVFVLFLIRVVREAVALTLVGKANVR